jgi:hypothetical protein
VFSSRRSWWNVLGAGLLAAGTIAAATGTSLVSAGASPGPLVGPNQLFAGFVNGNHFSPTVRMACFGPIRPGETGHPLAGQTFSVQLEVDVPGGFTGSSANRIVAFFAPVPSAVVSGVVLRRYGVAAPIPTSLTLPCSGRGDAEFAPQPATGHARPDVVPVTFVGQP